MTGVSLNARPTQPAPRSGARALLGIALFKLLKAALLIALGVGALAKR